MFQRRNQHNKNGLLKSQKLKKRVYRSKPDWDSTVQDLSVYAASPAELQRRKIVCKSKNVDLARRELKAKKAGIPASLLVSPTNPNLEMKKIALLSQGLYDHNDFMEVLRRADETMSSVKGTFHENSHSNAYPNVTAAPGYKKQNEVCEKPSRLDALSESVMDGTALNEEITQTDEEDKNGSISERKIDCDRILSLLKDALHNDKSFLGQSLEKTPQKPKRFVMPLNGTEQVKRIKSHLGDTSEQARNIENMLSNISKDTNEVRKKLQLSATQLPPEAVPSKDQQAISTNSSQILPRAHLTKCSMSYDDLQGAIKTINKEMLQFAVRRGLNEEASDNSDGLSGFTETLISAVSRLIIYVNEGELKQKKIEEDIEELIKRLDHLLSFTNLLKTELKSEQNKNKLHEQEIEILKENLLQDRNEHAKLIAELREDVRILKANHQTNGTLFQNLQKNEVREVDSSSDDKVESVDEDTTELTLKPPRDSVINPELKKDMISLLTALKSTKEQSTNQHSSVVNFTQNHSSSSNEIINQQSPQISIQLDNKSSPESTTSTRSLKDLPLQSPSSCGDFEIDSFLTESPLMMKLCPTDISPSTHLNKYQTNFPLSNLSENQMKIEADDEKYLGIRKSQMSLEERISQLTLQHNEAQSRLHNLLSHKQNEMTNQPKKVQITFPDPITLPTT